MTPRPKTIALYLPQFYPIPENDGWYGQGFTDWRNVVTARPLFADHYQPHLPKDFGFYDLRVPEVREEQALTARESGIDAFCYYHYWFTGHRPLRRVIDDVLERATPNIPFCLAWANENWSRHWDATAHEVLLEQRYSPEDDEDHGRFLLRAMTNPLYLRVDGRPVLFIYRIQAMPDPLRTITRWRQLWREGGLEDVHVVKFDTHGNFEAPEAFGADTAAQFLPHGIDQLAPRVSIPGAHPGNVVWNYDDVVRASLAAERPPWIRHECVVPNWDNTPRRGDGRSAILHGSTPERYEEWLSHVYSRAGANRFVVINAWNEWGEGAHLEPDLRYGRAYLRATARAVGAASNGTPIANAVTGSQQPFTVRDRFAELYLDALESQTRLQRRLSRFEATFERQLAEGMCQARAEADEMRAYALEFTREIDRLKAELARFAKEGRFRLSCLCMRILTILVRNGTEKYASAEHDLGDLFRRQLPAVKRTTVVVDNAPTEPESRHVDRALIDGDNSSSEFSGFDSGLAFVGDDLMSYDLVNLTTSAFGQLYVDYLERFRPHVLASVIGRSVCLGHIDCYDEPIEVCGCQSQHWIRTACMFLPPAEVGILGTFVSVRDREQWFSGDPAAPFKLDAPLSPTYKRLITDWLTGEDIGQGVHWHSRIALDEGNLPEFERKAVAILNEHLLGIRLRAAGCRTIDVTWLSGLLARGRSDIDWNTPWWRQLADRDRHALVIRTTRKGVS